MKDKKREKVFLPIFLLIIGLVLIVFPLILPAQQGGEVQIASSSAIVNEYTYENCRIVYTGGEYKKICSQYIGGINQFRDYDGQYKNLTDITNLTIDNGFLVYRWREVNDTTITKWGPNPIGDNVSWEVFTQGYTNQSITLDLFAIHQTFGVLRLSQFASFGGSRVNTILRLLNRWKFGDNISIPQSQANKILAVGYIIVNSTKPVTYSNDSLSMFFGNMKIDFSDIVTTSGGTINVTILNSSVVLISNMTGTTFGKTLLPLDPTVQNIALEDVYTDALVAPLGELGYQAFMKFNLSGLPPNKAVTINYVAVVLNATVITGVGATQRAYNCSGEWTELSSFATVTALLCSNTENSTSVTTTGLKYWNVTNAVMGMYESGAANITIRLNSSFTTNADILTNGNTLRIGLDDFGGGGNAAFATVHSSEATQGQPTTPFMNITYTQTIWPPIPEILSPPNLTYTSKNSFIVNISVAENTSLIEFTYNFNNTNFTFLNESVVGFYNLDDNNLTGENVTTGRIIDYSSFANHGTIQDSGGITIGALPNLTGKYHGAIEFNTTQAINLGNSNSLKSINSTFTLAVWVRPHNITSQCAGNTCGIVGSYPNGPMITGFNGNFRFYLCSGGNQIGTGAIANEQWYHVVGVYNGSSGNMTLYVNGTQAAIRGNSVSCQINGNMWIGKNNLATSFINATIDEVRIYNASLTAQEVYQLYISNLQKYNNTAWNFYANQSYNLSQGLFNNTNYTLIAHTRETNGLMNSTGTYLITTADRINPLLEVYELPNATELIGNPFITKTFIFYPSDTGLANATINLNSVYYYNYTLTNGTNNTFTIQLSAIDAPYQWNITLTDFEGNKNTSGARWVYVSLPEATSAGPGSGSPAPGEVLKYIIIKSPQEWQLNKITMIELYFLSNINQTIDSQGVNISISPELAYLSFGRANRGYYQAVYLVNKTDLIGDYIFKVSTNEGISATMNFSIVEKLSAPLQNVRSNREVEINSILVIAIASILAILLIAIIALGIGKRGG